MQHNLKTRNHKLLTRSLPAYGLLVFVVVIFWYPQWASAQDYKLNVGWIHYKDNSDREISYDFSSGVMDEYGVVTIPSDAVISVPPSESDTTFLWEPGFGEQEVVLKDGYYEMSIPQATETVKDVPTANIVIDGSVNDWEGVNPYIEDKLGEVAPWWPEADVSYIKLAYSPDGSKLYILLKANNPINKSVWYRFFLDKDLDANVDEPGDYQIDVQFIDSSWDVVSQGWNSYDGWDWYPVEENGLVFVSGEFIEAVVDSAAFGLPATVNIYGRTMQNTSPYRTYDSFSNYLLGSWGFSSMGAFSAAAPAPSEWQFAARIFSFENVSLNQHSYEVSVGAGSSEDDDVEPFIEACWFTGTYAGKTYKDALVIGARVENDLSGQDEYDWEWYIGEGGGLVITGLEPSTAVLDLKVDVTNEARTVSFYYRINSNEITDWQLAVAHTVPAPVRPMYGFFDVFPTIGIGTGIASEDIIGDFCGENFGQPDGYVDVWDLMLFADHWHTDTGDSNWDSKFDLTGPNFGPPDEYVDVWDLMLFADHWHEGEPP